VLLSASGVNVTTILSKFEERLAFCGFDVTHSFAISDLDFQLSDYLNEAIDENCYGILVGNTRELWVKFLSWLGKKDRWEEIENPIDSYTIQIIESASAQFFPGAKIFWMHEMSDYVVPAQQLAHSSGLAFLSRGHFTIHPIYGAWFALRAVILMNEKISIEKGPAVNPCLVHTEERAEKTFQELSANSTAIHKHIKTHWKEWLALRDIYQVGKKYRYSDAQIEYHYTHNKSVLLRELHAKRE
jgi:hypothetical protein